MTPSEDAGPGTMGRQVVTLASLGSAPFYLQVDSTNAYVSLGDDSFGDGGAVIQIPLSGGAPITLASGFSDAQGIAVTGTTVYWIEPFPLFTETPDASDGVVLGVPIGGGAATIVASGQKLPWNLAVDSTNVYWLDLGQCQGSTTCTGTLMTVSLAGGTPVVLASGLSLLQNLVVDDTSVYWAVGGRLMRVAKGGGTVTVLASYQGTIGSLVLDASNVYWTLRSGDVMKTPLDGGASTAIAITEDQLGFAGIAVDSTSAYWTTDGYPGSVKKVALDGGPPTTLWSGDNPEAIQVDGTSVYFTTYSGAVMKLTPK
jgi:hypothetical protein